MRRRLNTEALRRVPSDGWCHWSACRSPPIRLVVVTVVLLAGSLALVNFVHIVSDGRLSIDGSDSLPLSSSSSAVVADPASLLHRLPASLVRVETQPSSSGSGSNAGDGARVKLVLSVDVADLTDLMNSYRHGFVREPVRYPDDGGILMHNRNLCRQPRSGKLESRPISWIVYVHSSPDHAVRRQMLRDTWANLDLFKNFEFRVVFLIGLPAVANPELQAELRTEFEKYGDLVQGNFIDSYKNMTLKAVMGLRWLAEFCPEAPYALKADDDTFLNIFEIVPLMTANIKKPHVIICPMWPDNMMPILRDPKTCMKWCVKRSELRGRTHFPQYCAGIGYVVSSQLVPMLYNASRSTPFFWIDDVYVTGLLAQKLPVKPTVVDLLEHFSAHEDAAVEQYNNRSKLMTYWYVHAKGEDNYWSLWKSLMTRLADRHKEMINPDVLRRWTAVQ